MKYITPDVTPWRTGVGRTMPTPQRAFIAPDNFQQRVHITYQTY
jgi:hypothetical protein